MKATGGSDSDPDEKEATDQELLWGCQVFTSLASWKPNIPAPCLGAKMGVAGAKGRGGVHHENNVKSSTTEITRNIDFVSKPKFVS